MDWTKSYSAKWRVCKVNRQTWADGETVRNIESVSVTRTANGDLLESGSMEVTGPFENDYYRLIMIAEQGGEVERVDVATLHYVAKDGEHNYGTQMLSIDGESVLHSAATTHIGMGGYAPAGIDGAAYAGKLLQSAIIAPVKVEGSFTLNDNIVHEINCYVLDAVWEVLDAGGFCIQIDGRGVVHIKPMPTEPSLTIGSKNARLISTGIQFTADTKDIPNRYIVVVGDQKIMAVNDDPESEVSTVRRGYYVDEIDTSPTQINGESIFAYTERKLREASIMEDERVYTREYAPDVFLFSIVRASIDGLEGDLRVIEQSIECDHGILVEEKANREIRLWQ